MKKTKQGIAEEIGNQTKKNNRYRCCFAADTLVMTPDYPCPIQALVEGDRIVTYDPDRECLIEASVEKVEVFAGRFSVVEDYFGHDCVVRGTGTHYIYDGSGWIPCEELRVAMTATGRQVSAYSYVTNRIVHAMYRIETTSGTCLIGDEAVLVGGPSMKSLNTNTAHAAHVTSIHV